MEKLNFEFNDDVVLVCVDHYKYVLPTDVEMFSHGDKFIMCFTNIIYFNITGYRGVEVGYCTKSNKDYMVFDKLTLTMYKEFPEWYHRNKEDAKLISEKQYNEVYNKKVGL